jgi:hypothetical protein
VAPVLAASLPDWGFAGVRRPAGVALALRFPWYFAVELRGFEPLTPCMPLTSRWLMPQHVSIRALLLALVSRLMASKRRGAVCGDVRLGCWRIAGTSGNWTGVRGCNTPIAGRASNERTLWCNALLGRFRVERRANGEASSVMETCRGGVVASLDDAWCCTCGGSLGWRRDWLLLRPARISRGRQGASVVCRPTRSPSMAARPGCWSPTSTSGRAPNGPWNPVA